MTSVRPAPTTWAAYEFRVICDTVDERATAKSPGRIIHRTEGHDDPECASIDDGRVLCTETSLDDWTNGEPVPVAVRGEDGSTVILLAEYGEPWPCPCVPADALAVILTAAQSVPAAISGASPGRDASEDVSAAAIPETQTWRASDGQEGLLRKLLAERAGRAEAEAIRDVVNATRPLTWQVCRRAIEQLLAIPVGGGGFDPVFPEVDPGRYALTDPDGRLRFFRWEVPTRGRWKGRRRLSEERGAKAVALPIEKWPEVLAWIVEAGEYEAGERYAQNRVRCYRCGVALTDPISKRRGLGPDCAKKWGRS